MKFISDMTLRQRRTLYRILISAALTLALFFIPLHQVLRLFLYLVPYLIIGYDILYGALLGIKNLQPFDENFLMAIATVGAIILGDFTEATAVMLFYQTGELFQSYAVGKSRKSIGALMDIRPDCAFVEDENGQFIATDPEEIQIGTVIVVRPGERIPIDGVVLWGSSSLDTAALTGESVPRDVTVGDEVLSGCINLSGLLRLKTTKEFSQSTVSKILDLVENASSKKAKSEKFISRFARVYTPAVCLCAVLLALLPPIVNILLGNTAQFSLWLYRALTFLVISCPCALVISIPLGFFAGIGAGSRSGILIKGAGHLETLSYVRTVAFDKTGTLTKGVFEVSEVHCSDTEKEELLRLCALAEMHSNHPIAKSLTRAYGKKCDPALISEVKEIGGHGVCAVIEGKEVLVGNNGLMDMHGIPCPPERDIGTTVYVAENGVYLGSVVICDSLKPHSKRAMEALKAAGIKNTVMLTGDTEAYAIKTAQSLKIDTVFAQLLPEDKVKKAEELLSRMKAGERLAFVGDGINDAPVLSCADIGIAMGGLGSDAAIEAADIVLMDDDPLKIATAIALSKKCMGIVYENICFAIGVKLICLILGAVGFANMWLAIFADVGVMILAVLNSLRIMKG